MKAWLFVVTLILIGAAYTQQDLSTFLGGLKEHPALEASRIQLAAAARGLELVYSPVSVNASASYMSLDLSDPELRLPEPFDDLLSSLFDTPGGSTQLNLGASFRPFVFGDLRDLAQQRALELARAQLSYRETLTNLETEAITAASGVMLARDALNLARQAAALAARALDVTRLRAERGGASPAELRQAEQALTEALAALAQTEAELELAEARLDALVPEGSLAAIPDLPGARGTAPAVRRAELDVALARTGLRTAERALYPTAQASYTLLFDDNHALAVGLESRTLQPSLTYRYQDPPDTGGASGGLLEPLLPQPRGVFSVGVGLTISPETLSNAESARAALRAAEAALEATERQTRLTEQALDQAQANAQAQRDLAAQALEHSRQTLRETEARAEAGLVGELEREEARLQLAEATLELKRRELAHLDAVLDSYRSYAIPPSSQLPNEEAKP